MSHMHLARFSLTRLEQFFTTHAELIPTNLTSFELKALSPVVPWVVYYLQNSIFLISVSSYTSCVHNQLG